MGVGMARDLVPGARLSDRVNQAAPIKPKVFFRIARSGMRREPIALFVRHDRPGKIRVCPSTGPDAIVLQKMADDSPGGRDIIFVKQVEQADDGLSFTSDGRFFFGRQFFINITPGQFKINANDKYPLANSISLAISGENSISASIILNIQ